MVHAVNDNSPPGTSPGAGSRPITIIASGTRFAALSRYEHRHLLKDAGFRWGPSVKHWCTSDRRRVDAIAAHVANDIEEVARQIEANKIEERARSRANTAALDIPAPPGCVYLPHQKAGVAYALGRSGTLIADDMGLGKTITALGVVNATAPATVLVLCPATLKGNWRAEARKWLARPATIVTLSGKPKATTETTDDVTAMLGASGDAVIDPPGPRITVRGFPGADAGEAHTVVVIINYDVIAAWAPVLRAIPWDILIADEAHRLKNYQSKRAQAVLGGRDRPGLRADRTLFLTGTPILNRPREIYPLANYLQPGMLGAFRDFAERYCEGEDTDHGFNADGADRLPELQDKLRETVMIRRRKADVLADLPAKRTQVLAFTDRRLAALAKSTLAAAEAADRVVEVLARSLADHPLDPDARRKLADAKRQRDACYFELLHRVGVAKIPLVLDHVADAIESGKAVVFARHKKVIAALRERFGGLAVTIDGDTPIDRRHAMVERFQTDPRVRLFIGQIAAAGVGVTLTAASTVIFAELDLVPANLRQAEDRLHRIGQQEAVLVQYLLLDGSVDARVWSMLESKQRIADEALDDTKETMT